MGSFLSFLGGDAQNNFSGLESPTAQQMRYTPAQMAAERAKAAQIQGNAMSGVQGDQGAQAAQNQALQGEQEESQTGMTAADKAALSEGLNRAAQQSGAQQKAIMQHAAETGQAGSGSSLAAQLEGAQGAASANAGAGLEASQQAQQRRLGALGQVAQQGQAINQQTTQRQQAAAEAQNAINAANTNAQNQTSEFNAQAGNQAALANQAAQNAANQYNSQALEQQFQNQLGEDQAKSGAQISSEGVGSAFLGNMASGVGGAISGKAKGGMITEQDYRTGGRVPGKAAVAGDSAKNDNVPAMLSQGEVVLPREIVASGPHSWMEFLSATVEGHKPAAAAKKAKKPKADKADKADKGEE